MRVRKEVPLRWQLLVLFAVWALLFLVAELV